MMSAVSNAVCMKNAAHDLENAIRREKCLKKLKWIILNLLFIFLWS